MNIVRISVPKHQAKRLKGKCFRNRQALAGNFKFWKSADEMAGNDEVNQKFRNEIERLITEEVDYPGTWSFTITMDQLIGWISTAPLSDLPIGTEVEEFEPNDHTKAFKVTNLSRAPMTHKITFVVEIRAKNVRDIIVVAIHSIYPGEEVELGKHNNKRTILPEEAVFIDWNTSGE